MMDTELIKIFGQIAGIGGLAIGVFLLVAKELIRKAIFPALTKQQASIIILLLAFMAWTIALAGVGAWTYIYSLNNNSANQNYTLPTIPGGTGWIFAGYFNEDIKEFIEGPYVSVEQRMTRADKDFIDLGDKVELKVDRRLIIVGFKKTGTKNRMVPPINVGIISDNDDTDIVIPKGTKMVVRDVIAGSWPGNPNRALWLRVVYEPK